MPLGRKIGFDPSDIVLDGEQAPPPQKGDRVPQFSVHVYCGETVGWINMPLGMKVGLDPSDMVLDGDQLSSPKGGRDPNFLLVSIVAKRLHG